jgi:hypothetical protein|tara:strand:+ start:633 stop:1613 length:981 start_codon:yes stop_codon:yes gene_type:complete
MSTPYIGRLVHIGSALEAVRGEEVAPTTWIPKTLLTVEDVAEKVTSVESRGNIWGFSNEELVVGRHAEGDLEMELGNETIATFLQATMGTASSGAFNGVYQHTFTLQDDNAHDSLTLTVVDEVDQVQFGRAMINSFGISVAVGELVKATVNFMSNPHTDSDGHSMTYNTNEFKFGHQHVTLKIASDASSLDAASALSIKDFNITINKNLVLDNALGTVQPTDILNQSFTIEGSFTLNSNNRTFRDLMNDATYQALRMDIVNTDQTIGSTNPALRIDLSRCSFFDWSKDQPNDELVTETINFRALYDVVNKNVVDDFYLVNQAASVS